MTDPHAPWSNESQLARIDARMRELKVSEAALMKERGFPSTKDMRDKDRDPPISPRLNTCEKRAEILGWTLPQLLGIEPQRVLALDTAKLSAAIMLTLAVVNLFDMNGSLSERAARLTILVQNAYGLIDLGMKLSPNPGEILDPSSQAFAAILARFRLDHA